MRVLCISTAGCNDACCVTAGGPHHCNTPRFFSLTRRVTDVLIFNRYMVFMADCVSGNLAVIFCGMNWNEVVALCEIGMSETEVLLFGIWVAH